LLNNSDYSSSIFFSYLFIQILNLGFSTTVLFADPLFGLFKLIFFAGIVLSFDYLVILAFF